MKNCLIIAFAVILILGWVSSLPSAEPLPEPGTAEQFASPSTGSPAADTAHAPLTSVDVYYFHTSRRCRTCLTIEANAKEAVETGFAPEIAEGRVSWHEVNFETKENAHFVKDFDLMFSSVIVVKYLDGKQAEWKNLQRIWELVRDKPAFMDYVRSEVQTLLEL